MIVTGLNHFKHRWGVGGNHASFGRSLRRRSGSSKSRPTSYNQELAWLHQLERQCVTFGSKWVQSPLRSALQAQLDFRFPAEWYGVARARGPRTIYCHVGPTNSGKTHAAIQRLREAQRGVYCAPLRLLAMEMWEKLNNSLGKPCALRTGEISSGPTNDPTVDFQSVDTLSCTVEMLDLNREFDVAVIDEIQMLADEQRGWAFTQALLGVNAREVYVCGEEAALKLVEAISKETGDKVIVHRYERLTPLLVSEKSLGGRLGNLKPGDCVVAFSRKKIFETKYLIESQTGRKCAVVYGNLPMENRSLQARVFNERQDGYQVMVASDAVGMGINLNIQRVVFFGVKQFGREGIRLVPSSRIKQIAGRAGRFGFGADQGVATCLHDQDMEYFLDCMKTPNEEYPQAGMAPPASLIEALAHQFTELPLTAILSAITDGGKYKPHFAPCISREQKLIVHLLEEFPQLSIGERLLLASAPVNLRDSNLVNAFYWFVSCLAERRPCPLRVDLRHHRQALDYLAMAESFYRTLDLYLWLGSRFPETYIEREQVLEKRELCSALVEKLLGRITIDRQAELPSIPGLHRHEGDLLREQPESDISSLEKVLKDIESQTK